jgi:hypothetical protein
MGYFSSRRDRNRKIISELMPLSDRFKNWCIKWITISVIVVLVLLLLFNIHKPTP